MVKYRSKRKGADYGDEDALNTKGRVDALGGINIASLFFSALQILHNIAKKRNKKG
jgi:hypothetical protein